ncbi:MAG: phosphate acetyltransferase [Firmicutes bacterium ZCTH02-B6]|nr:MAG: phosphate acetyltransferase [Firmicutes bacterium ZCTH02-B6]
MAMWREEALEYHRRGRPGKLEIKITKPTSTQRDLSLAYSPGVAEPVRAIHADPHDAFQYTAKGNLVAVISNGTAVLGLGNVGALAAKPVMEGKGVLFKRFADIDVFDLEIDCTDPDELVRIVKSLEPTFGGINLEDIKAPECFVIEERLREIMEIPVFHDDQHGTAIIAGAGLINALALVGKDIGAVKVVINGAGASGIACAKFFLELGVKRENLWLCDSQGVVRVGREQGMNPYKAAFAQETDLTTLEEVLRDADVFVGLSVAGAVTPEMLKSMADRPIVFALANPDPEISYDEAKAARPDAIVATGRSDFPNQVNNVLGFPFIFRGALDVQARTINEAMKVAAARALAELARQPVPDVVLRAYGLEQLRFGPDYIIPKPLDPRVLLWVAPAVARAAMETGVARVQLDLDEYVERLEARFGKGREIRRFILHKAATDPKRVVFAEGERARIIRAAAIVQQEGIGRPILVGRPEVVRAKARELGVPVDLEIVEPSQHPRLEEYIQHYYQLRQRRGITLEEARQRLQDPIYFGCLMVKLGDADAFVAGLGYHYPDVIRPALEVFRTRPGVSRVAGMYIMTIQDRVYFFTDATVNIEPSAEELAEIAIMAADRVRQLGIEPRIAMLSFSNFGSTRHPLAEKVRRATELVKAQRPDLMADGEMQADTAVVPEILERDYPFSDLKGGANVLVFPDLEAANIAYKLLQRLGGAEAMGPILMGLNGPVHVLQRGDDVDAIVNIAAVAVMDAQELGRR